MPREEPIMDDNRIDALNRRACDLIGIDWLDMEAQEGLAQALRDVATEAGLERVSQSSGDSLSWEIYRDPGDGALVNLWVQEISTGSPISPVFTSSEELVTWLADAGIGADWVRSPSRAPYLS